ncbi:MAG: hypothetical protein KDA71_23135, partial [Planctomycetales bacterium]|nr:hypothetical protein [Planctomycetales bacterium]
MKTSTRTIRRTMLVDFVERSFLPHTRPDAGESSRKSRDYVIAAEWLGTALGRPATLGDLTAPNVRATLRTMIESGCQAERIKFMRRALLRIWRYAFRTGFAKPVREVPMPTVRQSRFRNQPPAGGTLLAFYRDEFRPAIVASSKVTDSAIA